eukprot:Transcript_14548.p1 GENE.Transcript_14548~~Transcript_14548.p1  ORF type:complete len:254 (-),score=55.58 Transcript_14548:51-758(-)
MEGPGGVPMEAAVVALLASPEAKAQARAAEAAAAAEGLTLHRSGSESGFTSVYINSTSRGRPYVAQVRRDGKLVYLGQFVTAEEAALAVARAGRGSKRRRCDTGPVPTNTEEAEAQARRAEEAAEAEGLTLKRSSNQTGFACVYVDPKNKARPFVAQVRREGKLVYLNQYATAEEAALAVARAPAGDGGAAKKRKARKTAGSSTEAVSGGDGGDGGDGAATPAVAVVATVVADPE